MHPAQQGTKKSSVNALAIISNVRILGRVGVRKLNADAAFLFFGIEAEAAWTLWTLRIAEKDSSAASYLLASLVAGAVTKGTAEARAGLFRCRKRVVCVGRQSQA